MNHLSIRLVGTATVSTVLASMAVLGCSKTSDPDAKNASSAQPETSGSSEDEASIPSTVPREEVKEDEAETSSVGPEHMGSEPGGERSTSAADGNPNAPAAAHTPGAATDSSHAGADLATQIDHVALNVQQIATAECDLEERCDGIGPDGKYATRGECMRKIEGSYGDLHSGDCKAGLDPLRLDTCLQAIHATECASPKDGVDRLAACREGTLCQD
jgi:hypothetical protein